MSQQFYIAVNGQQTGPFSYDDLKTKGVQKDTLIWTEGLGAWTKAEHVALLKNILLTTPPPIPNFEAKIQSQQVTPPPVVTAQPTGKYFGYELAKRRERLFADLAQVIIISIPILMIFGPDDLKTQELGDRFNLAILLGVFGGLVNLIFYPLWSGNIGHKIMGIKVISAKDGSNYNNSIKGAIREFLKHLFGVFIIPSIWLLWDKNKQNLYDKVVNTYVVKKK